jgi:hypothetical protein
VDLKAAASQLNASVSKGRGSDGISVVPQYQATLRQKNGKEISWLDGLPNSHDKDHKCL